MVVGGEGWGLTRAMLVAVRLTGIGRGFDGGWPDWSVGTGNGFVVCSWSGGDAGLGAKTFGFVDKKGFGMVDANGLGAFVRNGFGKKPDAGRSKELRNGDSACDLSLSGSAPRGRDGGGGKNGPVDGGVAKGGAEEAALLGCVDILGGDAARGRVTGLAGAGCGCGIG